MQKFRENPLIRKLPVFYTQWENYFEGSVNKTFPWEK